jgi:hypothetical protein
MLKVSMYLFNIRDFIDQFVKFVRFPSNNKSDSYDIVGKLLSDDNNFHILLRKSDDCMSVVFDLKLDLFNYIMCNVRREEDIISLPKSKIEFSLASLPPTINLTVMI